MAVQAGDPFVAQQPENMAMLTPDEPRQAVAVLEASWREYEAKTAARDSAESH